MRRHKKRVLERERERERERESEREREREIDKLTNSLFYEGVE